jgi:hypothetical protein
VQHARDVGTHNGAQEPDEQPKAAQDAASQGLPAFAAGSHARRHCAAFHRCIVQALALIQAAAPPENASGTSVATTHWYQRDACSVPPSACAVSPCMGMRECCACYAEEERLACLKSTLQQRYPLSLVLRQHSQGGLEAEGAGGPAVEAQAAVEGCAGGLAFVRDMRDGASARVRHTGPPEAQQAEKPRGSAPSCMQGAKSGIDDSVGVAGNAVEPSGAGCSAFSACLASGQWQQGFRISEVSQEILQEAAAVLMQHWEAALEGAVHALAHLRNCKARSMHRSRHPQHALQAPTTCQHVCMARCSDQL